MGKKSRTQKRKSEDIFENFDDLYDNDVDLDLDELSMDIHGMEPVDYYYEQATSGNVRRTIERRSDMRKLYSQLNDWDEYDERESWNWN